MADSFQTLAQLVTLNDKNLADYEISDLFTMAPALAVMPAVMASNGTLHKYLKETTAPTVGFRAVNDGRENSKSVRDLVTLTLKIMDASFATDIELAKAYKGGVDAFLQMETVSHLKQSLFEVESQLWYGTGTGGDSAGFAGLGDNAGYDKKDDTYVVDAAGSTAGTASSAWLLVCDPGLKGVAVVGGNDANITIEDPVITRIAGSSTGTFPAYYVPISGYVGFQIGGAATAVRICNLTEDSGKGLTDVLIANAIEKVPTHYRPYLKLFINRRSQRQLQASRTATTATGTPAPFPEESFGVPIIVTDSILSTETLLTATA